MTINKVIGLLYELSDDYIATNCSKDSNDIAYDEGFKAGIEGFRKAMTYHLRTYCQEGEE